MSLTAVEISNLEIVLKRNHFFIHKSARWGDLCDIKNEADGMLLYVHRPLGYKTLIYVLGLLALLLVIGFNMTLVAKLLAIAAVSVGVFIAIQLQPKREISFYTDHEYKKLVFRVVQKKGDKMLAHSCEVLGTHGELVGILKSDFSVGAKAIWRIYKTPKELVGRAAQQMSSSDMMKAYLSKFKEKRLLQTQLFPIFRKESNALFGEISLQSGAADHIDLEADPDFVFDRRLALALAVVIRAL